MKPSGSLDRMLPDTLELPAVLARCDSAWAVYYKCRCQVDDNVMRQWHGCVGKVCKLERKKAAGLRQRPLLAIPVPESYRL